MIPLTIIAVRSLILYLYIMFIVRFMGKRQVGEMQPFELVVAILIADLAAVPMESPEMPLIHGLIPVAILAIMEMTISYLSLHREGFRRLVTGSPSIIIINGKICEAELRKMRYNLNDLLEQLRIKGFHNIEDVEFAILETSGQLSVIPKSQKRPVTPEDLQIPTEYEGLSHPLILDGVVHKGNLIRTNLTEEWLQEQLSQQGFSSPRTSSLPVSIPRDSYSYSPEMPLPQGGRQTENDPLHHHHQCHHPWLGLVGALACDHDDGRSHQGDKRFTEGHCRRALGNCQGAGRGDNLPLDPNRTLLVSVFQRQLSPGH